MNQFGHVGRRQEGYHVHPIGTSQAGRLDWPNGSTRGSFLFQASGAQGLHAGAGHRGLSPRRAP
eukprot:4847548-Pyramimonas_sp.AAC.1